MNITPRESGPIATSAVPGAQPHGGSDMRHLQWRAELERAQWQERLRYSPMPDADRHPQEGARTTDAAVQTPARADVSPPAMTTRADPLTAHDTSPPAPSTMSNATGGTAASQAFRTSVPMALNGFGGTTPSGQRLAAQAAPVRTTAALPTFDLPFWHQSATHVSLQGKRLSVAVRDATLEEADGPRLRDQLRARCERCGLELAELTINGIPVESATP